MLSIESAHQPKVHPAFTGYRRLLGESSVYRLNFLSFFVSVFCFYFACYYLISFLDLDMITQSPTSDDIDFALNSPQSPMRRILHVPMMTPEKKLVHVPLMTPDRRPVEVGDMQFTVKSNNQNSYMIHTTPNKSTPIKQLPFSPSQVGWTTARRKKCCSHVFLCVFSNNKFFF